MNLVADGIIYHLQKYGGISRIFTEILPRMCRQDDSLDITLLMGYNSQQVLPQHHHIIVKSAPSALKLLKPDIIWYSVTNELRRRWRESVIGDGKGKVWHSTYYTMPNVWRGKIVTTVVDMISELYPELFYGPESEQFRQHKRRCILDADAIICISETTRKDIISYYEINPDKITVIPLACSDVFRVLDSEADQSQRTKAGLEAVKKYSWDETARQTLEVYRKLLSRI